MIDIYGVNWQIKYCSPDIMKSFGYDDIIGHCNERDYTIYIDETLKPQQKRRTLIHEIVHAIIFVLGYTKIDKFESVCLFVEAHLDYIYKLITELDSDEE